MDVKPVAGTNFLGEFKHKGVPLNRNTRAILGTVACCDDLGISISPDTGYYRENEKAYTVYVSKKYPIKLSSPGWESAVHNINRYETVVVPKTASVDTMSEQFLESAIKNIKALGERVAEFTGKNPEFLSYFKKFA